MDAILMGPNLREEDAEELWAATEEGPLEALKRCYVDSVECWTGLWYDEPAVMFGITDKGYQDGLLVGVPWLLATPDVYDFASIFARWSRYWLRRVETGFDFIKNTVYAENELHIRWIEWLGCTFTGTVIGGPHQRTFLEFEKHV